MGGSVSRGREPGVCFAGVKRLQENENSVPVQLFMQWLAMAAKIQQRNEDMDRKTAEVWALLNKAGLDCAVLKGQGVALLYNLNLDLNLDLDLDLDLNLNLNNDKTINPNRSLELTRSMGIPGHLWLPIYL